MFYEPDKNNHGLPHDPFKSIVVPRPIGWISSIDREGRVAIEHVGVSSRRDFEDGIEKLLEAPAGDKRAIRRPQRCHNMSESA